MSDAYGPIDCLVLEIPEQSAAVATAAALVDLVERDVVAVYDLMLVRKTSDGSTHEVALLPGTEGVPAGLTAFAGARSGLFGDEDVAEAANALQPGTSALVVLYENRWAVPFVRAAREEGIEVVASARLTAKVIMDVLDALEALV
jgi:hypothetical protein